MDSFFIKSTSQRGFTLLEVIIVLFIFVLASLLISEIFINVQRAQNRTRDVQTSLTDARYLLDVLAREIRSKELDYEGYGGTISVPADDANGLRLVDVSGVKIFRHATATDCGLGYLGGCVQVSNNEIDWHNVTTPQLAVDVLKFYVNPINNPYPESVTVATPDIQPHVTIILRGHSARQRVVDQVPIYLQTTVTARYYKR